MSDDLKKKLEAILFSVGDRISIEELSKLTKEKDLDLITKTLRDIRDTYNKEERPVALHEEGTHWKMNVREEHASTVRKIVKKMELSKTLLETLAVIAWKAPVKQSIVIAVRTNKAYDHLVELEKMGYITRKKFGRTKLINLSQKFYDYFEINKKGGLNRVFKRVTDRAKKKYGHHFEEEIEARAEEQFGDAQDPVKEEIKEDSKTLTDDEIDKKLETYDEKEEVKVIDKDETGETVDELKVYEEEPKIEIIDEISDKPQETNKDSEEVTDKVKIYDENDSAEPTNSEEKIVMGGKELTPENIEKLKKAQELIEKK